MYNYEVGYVWDGVLLTVEYRVSLGEMLTLWSEILLTFGVDLRLDLGLLTGEYRWK